VDSNYKNGKVERDFDLVLEVQGKGTKQDRDEIENILYEAYREINKLEKNKDQKTDWKYYS